MKTIKLLTNGLKSFVIFIANLFGMDDHTSSNDQGINKDQVKTSYQDEGVNRSINRASKNILGNDFASSSRRNRPYIGECAGIDICYFIGSIEMYNLVREAAKRSGLANVHSFVRTLETYVGGNNASAIEIEGA